MPLHLHEHLGFGAFIVGLVTGSQFGASLLSRVWAGRYADAQGPKRAVILGLITAVAAGILYLVSLRFDGAPEAAVTIVQLGRALLGSAESFIITGAVSWGLVLAGAENAGRVIAWIGMAMFAALALGAPLGTALYSAGGFAAAAIATTLMPLATILLVSILSAVAPQPGPKPSFRAVAAAVWLPGFGSALSTIGFGAIVAFGSLLAAQRGWSPLWLVFTAFAVSLVAARLLLGHLPDQFGGARVALFCVLIETAGLALIGLASGPALAAAGAALTGFGCQTALDRAPLSASKRDPFD